MSRKRFLPLQSLNVEDADSKTKSNGWISIDKVCAEMSVSRRSSFVSGNLRITQRDVENADDKENRNSPLLTLEKSSIHPKLSGNQITATPSRAESAKIVDHIISIGLKSESQLCSSDLLKDRSSPYISHSMRSKLLSWITEVCESFELTREVFFLSIDVLDRYLASEGARGLRASHFQLVGIACLFISAKYESVDLCEAKKYAEMTGGAFSAQELVNMELRVLRSLKWHLNIPTSINWLKMYLQMHATSTLTTENPKYSCYNLLRGSKILSLVLFDPCCFRFQRSLIASTIFMMLTKTTSADKWENLTCYTNYDLQLCFRTIFPIIRPEMPFLSSVGHEAFKCRDSSDRHDIQRWEPAHNSKQKRFCSA